MRLIDTDAIEKEYHEELHAYYKDDYGKGFQAGLLVTIKQPTIEAEPVVHGEWILKDDHGKGVCSNCHRQDKIDPLAGFCRYCGADMRGEQNE